MLFNKNEANQLYRKEIIHPLVLNITSHMMWCICQSILFELCIFKMWCAWVVFFFLEIAYSAFKLGKLCLELEGSSGEWRQNLSRIINRLHQAHLAWIQEEEEENAQCSSQEEQDTVRQNYKWQKWCGHAPVSLRYLMPGTKLWMTKNGKNKWQT